MSPRVALRRLLVVGLLVLAGALAASCTTLPDSGPVHTRDGSRGSGTEQAPYFDPPGPTPGDSPEDIVRGFLLAMQANPPSTAAAREFLTEDAGKTWDPSEGTMVYEGVPQVADNGSLVTLTYDAAHLLDSRGGWLGDATGSRLSEQLDVVEEGGEWRIANPPRRLAVPASYFASLYVPFNLYFFDRTGSVLVPDRVYLPSGEQVASNLVRALLRGPGRDLVGVTRSALPARTILDIGVVVSGSGTADVPLGAGMLKLSAAQLERASAQLGRTLGQVPGIKRVRITVDDAPVPLPGGRLELGVGGGSSFLPDAGLPDNDPVALRQGRVVKLTGDASTPVGGPLGSPGFSLRSLAYDGKRGLVAGVSGNGQQVFVAPTAGDDARVRSVFAEGVDLARPAYDTFGTLWLLDRTGRGAVIRAISKDTTRVVRMPGITGQAVTAFTVTPDGTRLVALMARPGSPELRVGSIERTGSGRAVSGRPARVVRPEDDVRGPAADLGLVGPTRLAVLTHPTSASGRIVFLEIDGSPGGTDANPPDVVPARTRELVTTPFGQAPVRVVVGDGRLLRISETTEWVRAAGTGFAAAAYPR